MAFLIKEYTHQTTATPQAIWYFYSNQTSWPTWDDEIEYVKINGPFQTGQTGKLKPKGGPRVKFVITACIPYKKFSAISYLPLTQLSFDHILENKDGITLITHKAQISGHLAFFFKFILGKNIAKGIPLAIQKLATMAEHYGKN